MSGGKGGDDISGVHFLLPLEVHKGVKALSGGEGGEGGVSMQVRLYAACGCSLSKWYVPCSRIPVMS